MRWPERVDQYKKQLVSWFYDEKDKISREDFVSAAIALTITILAYPFILLYQILIRPLLALIGIKNVDGGKSLENHLADKYKADGYDEKRRKEEELEKRLSLDDESVKTFSAKKLWPEAIVKDGTAIYGSDGRTLLHVHENVEEFIIPEGTVNIYHKCFTLCTRLRRVVLPSSLRRIGNSAFSNCISLKEITIPETVESIGTGVFKNCVSLETVRIPSTMVDIPDEMFSGCRSLRSFILPAETTMICRKAFARCTSLEHIHVNDKLEMIREKAFEDCWSLKEFQMPDTVRFIELGTFNNCHSMERLHLSMLLKDFGGSCCENCWSLREIAMTPNPAFIEKAHYDWEHFSKGMKPEESECPYPGNIYWTYDNALYTNIPRLSNAVLVLCLSKEEEFTVPDFVVSVKQYAFTTCKSLRRLRLSPKLHPLAKDWSETEYITHEFIFECWPQIEEISFEDALNHKPFPLTFI